MSLCLFFFLVIFAVHLLVLKVCVKYLIVTHGGGESLLQEKATESCTATSLHHNQSFGVSLEILRSVALIIFPLHGFD